MKKIIFLACVGLMIAQLPLNAQKFLKPFESVSRKKSSFVAKEDGTEIEGTIDKLKRKKGLIKEINIKNENKEKMTIPMEDIKHAYFPQSGWDKMMKLDAFVADATQWNDGLYNEDRLKEGYALFEKTEVQVKKKKMNLLMQLLNPGTCSRIKVYHDSFASETASVGIGGVKLAGGIDKSYYIQKDGETAYKLDKKSFKKSFGDVFGDCKAIAKKYTKVKWSQFEEIIFEYNAACKK